MHQRCHHPPHTATCKISEVMSMTEHVSHFINGKKINRGTEKASIFNPATGEVIREVTFADAPIANETVKAANDAFPAWSHTTALRRARIMFRFKELLQRDFMQIVGLITQEHGKILSDANGELTRGMEVVEFACGAPYLLKGDFSENVGTNVDCHSIRQALGVCVGITPFNFPAMVPMWMFPIALVCGNTFILKPSEKDPSVALKMAELLQEAGLPDGVFNVLQGGRGVVEALITHPDVAAVSFVGSTPIAKTIHSTARHEGKRVQALGGAKNHCVIMPDADIDQAADGLMGAAFGSAGERCMAISVAVAVGDDTADALINKLKERMKKLNVGDGTEQNADMGPLISKEHLEKVRSYVDAGVNAGADLLVDGRGVKVQGKENGFFLGPCLFDRVTPEMKIYQEEIFGPVLCLLRVKTFDEAVELINNNHFANGTAIYTNSGALGRQFASKIKVGMIGVNVPIPVPMAFHSFGGWKQSLFGDMHMHGMEGFQFYTRLKTITTRWPTTASTGAKYTMPTME